MPSLETFKARAVAFETDAVNSSRLSSCRSTLMRLDMASVDMLTAFRFVEEMRECGRWSGRLCKNSTTAALCARPESARESVCFLVGLLSFCSMRDTSGESLSLGSVDVSRSCDSDERSDE